MANLSVATGDVAETGEVDGIGTLLVGSTRSGPTAGRTTETDVGSIVIADVNVGWVGLLGKVLVGALLVGGGLAVHLDLVTTKERCNPVGWTILQSNTTGDTNVCAGVVDGELTSGDGVGVVTTKVRPLKDVFTVGDPVRDLEIGTFASTGLATVKATETVARAGVALALDSVDTVEQIILTGGLDKVCHGLDEGDLDESTIVVVPPPFERDLLATDKVVLVGNTSSIETTSVLVSVNICRVLVDARNGLEHVGVGQGGRGGGDDKGEFGEEHVDDKKNRKEKMR